MHIYLLYFVHVDSFQTIFFHNIHFGFIIIFDLMEASFLVNY